MSVILARIDDRLIHGQVTVGWCAKLTPDIVLVVSDDVALSDWEAELCLAALPICYKGIAAKVSEAPRKINELDADPRNAYVLFESPKDAWNVVKNGARLTHINVGGMHAKKGKREILDYLFLNEEDAIYLKTLQDKGITLDFRDLPNRENVDVMSLI